jgi:predicted MFS family arabinose efflux permease
VLQFENLLLCLYKSGRNSLPDDSSNPVPQPQARGATIIAAGLLLVALALVVLYTSRRAFLSPVALVVVAAIGVAALLLQLRLQPSLSSSARVSSARGPLWFNAFGVAFALGALFADVLHLNGVFMLIAALAAVVSFAVSGLIVFSTLRKQR